MTVKSNDVEVAVRTHGWAGVAPATDEEAVARIVQVSGEILDEGRDDPLTILEVARRVGITRQTVYRYFSGTDDLLAATAAHAAKDFLEGLAESLRGIEDLADAVVEALAMTIERLYANKRFRVLFSGDYRGELVLQVTSPPAIRSGRSIVDEFDVDWSGWDEDTKDELVEHMLRMLQSFILAPGDPPRLGVELRTYLRRWMAPACDALVAAH